MPNALALMEGKILFIPIFHRDKKIGMTAGNSSSLRQAQCAICYTIILFDEIIRK
jgi:hypothetical protein